MTIKRKGCLRAGLITLGVLIVAAVVVSWFWADYPFASHDLDRQWARAEKDGFPLTAADLRAKDVSDEQNAASQLEEAVSQVGKEKLAKVLQNVDRAPKDLGPSPGARLQTLDRVKPALTLVEQAVQKPKLLADRDYDLSVELQFPEFQTYKGLIRALSIRAQMETERKDLAGAIRDVRTGRKLAALVATEPLIVGQLGAIAMDAILDTRIERLAQALAQDGKGLAALRKQTVEDLPLHPDFRVGLRGEMYYGLAATRNAARYGGAMMATGVIRNDEQTPPDTSEPVVRTGQPTGWVARALEARMMDGWNEMLEAPEWKKGDALALAELEDRVAAEHSMDKTHKMSYAACDVLFPTFHQAALSMVRSSVQRTTLDALLKVLEYRAAHGAFPKTLSEVGADAPDPFAKNGRLHYKAQGNSAKVWSVGPDGKDDGGDSKDNKDVVSMYPARSKV